MNSLVNLPYDIQPILVQMLSEICPISFVMLSHVSKTYYRLTSNLILQTNSLIKRKVECREIALRGYLSILQWARSQRYQWDTEVYSNAAWNGHLNVLKWAHQNCLDMTRKMSLNA